MGDELEKFVMGNREAFDSEMPDDKVWRGIHKKVQKRRVSEQLWKAAAVLLLMSTVYLAWERSFSSFNKEEVVEDLSEFEQVENYYTQLIAEKKSEISSYKREDLKRTFLVEIERLDQMYEELKTTYKKQNASDMLVDAMISNLKLRIDILNQQLKILKKLNESKNENITI